MVIAVHPSTDKGRQTIVRKCLLSSERVTWLSHSLQCQNSRQKRRSGDEDKDENERECSRKTGKQGVPAVSRNLPPARRLEGWTAG